MPATLPKIPSAPPTSTPKLIQIKPKPGMGTLPTGSRICMIPMTAQYGSYSIRRSGGAFAICAA